MTDIGGSVEPGFEGVADAFRANFEQHGEVGAATSVYVAGRKVVDLWGGVADRAAGTPYTEDSLQLVFSTTKGATAACANLLAQRGDLDVDAPVAHYWPEFKAAGKGDIPVRWLLCHKAGLPYVDAELTLEEALAWDPMIRALEEQAPVWEPGTAHGYHATTYGWLVGEVVRRISGKSLGTFFHDEIAEPLGLEFWIGLPDEQQARVAPLLQWGDGKLTSAADPAMAELIAQFMGPDTVLGKALGAPSFVFPDAEAGRQGLGAADDGSGQVPLLRDHLRARVLRVLAVRALRRRAGLRPHRRRGIGGIHRPRARDRLRLRDEQDDAGPQRRPAL